MANDSKPYQEEEYLFSEDEHADPLNPGESTVPDLEQGDVEKEPFGKIWQKNLMIGVGLLVIVFIVYKIIGTLFSHHDVKKQLPEIPAQSSLQTALPQSSVTNSSLEVGTPVPLNDSMNLYNQNPQEAEQLKQLTATTQNIGEEMSNLQGTTQTLQSSVNNINTQLSQINTALTALANQMQIQENRWLQSQKKPKPKPLPPKKTMVKPETYQTLAVIPGRAWLKSSKGATITVGVGSEIPGYGKVVTINTQLGRVTMSTGDTISYAPNDE